MKRYDINGSSTIFEGKIYDRMMDNNLPPWVREMMIDKIVKMLPDRKARRPYTVAKILGIHGKTASRLVDVAYKKWYERNGWKIELEKARLRQRMEDIWAKPCGHINECKCAEKKAKYERAAYAREGEKVWAEIRTDNQAVILEAGL